MIYMKYNIIFIALFLFIAFPAFTKVKIPSNTPKDKIIDMNPDEVDPSELPLDSIDQLHKTGEPKDVDLKTWRLFVGGKEVYSPHAFSYQELEKFPKIRKRVLLICPTVFADYAEWEGFRLSDLLKKVKVKDSYKSIEINGLDGYSQSFTRKNIETHLIFIATKVNGQKLPKDHGFPVRLVAEGGYGSSWVKWIKEIIVE